VIIIWFDKKSANKLFFFNSSLDLDLSDNKIDRIERGTFKELPSLDSLNLNFNRIEQIPENSLPEHVKLLKLSNNKLENVLENLFESLPQLITIDLQNNNIRELPANVFKNNTKLNNILLGGNKIKFMSPETFEILRDLKTVDLEENDCVSGVYGPSALKALKIDIERNCQYPFARNQIESQAKIRHYQTTPNYKEDSDRNKQERLVSIITRQF
jgi:Leucine-rich repeat (LRR) protein